MRSIVLALVLAIVACEPPRMGLPTTRETTATPADPVDSNTINAIQDAIIGGLTGSRTYRYGPNAYESGVAATVTKFPDEVVANPMNGNVSLDGIPVGKQITAIRVRVKDIGANAIEVEAYKVDPSHATAGATYTQLGTTQTSDGSGDRQTLTISGLTEVIELGRNYAVTIAAVGAAANHKMVWVEVDAGDP